MAVVVAAVRQTPANTIFDNGPVDSTRLTWNDTGPNYTIYDDFRLATDSTITERTEVVASVVGLSLTS